MNGVKSKIVGTRIDQCSACKAELPLCQAANPEDVRKWVCGRCGMEYSAVLAPDYSIFELRNVRPEPVIFDPRSVQILDPEMLAFVHRFDLSDNHRIEKRSSIRHEAIATLNAMEVDKRLKPVGTPFETICRNLSASGICLINAQAIQSDFLVIELSGAGKILIQTLAHIRRHRPVGPYYDIGIEFVTKFRGANQ
jgi:hypothetical protein